MFFPFFFPQPPSLILISSVLSLKAIIKIVIAVTVTKHQITIIAVPAIKINTITIADLGIIMRVKVIGTIKTNLLDKIINSFSIIAKVISKTFREAKKIMQALHIVESILFISWLVLVTLAAFKVATNAFIITPLIIPISTALAFHLVVVAIAAASKAITITIATKIAVLIRKSIVIAVTLAADLQLLKQNFFLAKVKTNC